MATGSRDPKGAEAAFSSLAGIAVPTFAEQAAGRISVIVVPRKTAEVYIAVVAGASFRRR